MLVTVLGGFSDFAQHCLLDSTLSDVDQSSPMILKPVPKYERILDDVFNFGHLSASDIPQFTKISFLRRSQAFPFIGQCCAAPFSTRPRYICFWRLIWNFEVHILAHQSSAKFQRELFQVKKLSKRTLASKRGENVAEHLPIERDQASHRNNRKFTTCYTIFVQ